MSIAALLADPTADWSRNPPARADAIQRLVQKSGIELPAAYLEALRYSDGGEGEFFLPAYGAFSPGWFQLWSVRRVLEATEASFIIDELPGFFAFAGNGAGEFFAFDTRTPQPWRIVMFPFLHSGEADGILIAHSFEEFVGGMGRVDPAEPPLDDSAT